MLRTDMPAPLPGALCVYVLGQAFVLKQLALPSPSASIGLQGQPAGAPHVFPGLCTALHMRTPFDVTRTLFKAPCRHLVPRLSLAPPGVAALGSRDVKKKGAAVCFQLTPTKQAPCPVQ